MIGKLPALAPHGLLIQKQYSHSPVHYKITAISLEYVCNIDMAERASASLGYSQLASESHIHISSIS